MGVWRSCYIVLKWFQNCSAVSFPKTSKTFDAYRPIKDVKLRPKIFSNAFHQMSSINYSQTCSNDHLRKTTTCLRRPMPSPRKPIPIQLLLYDDLLSNATRDHFFCPPKERKKKNCVKQPLQNFIQRRNG